MAIAVSSTGRESKSPAGIGEHPGGGRIIWIAGRFGMKMEVGPSWC